MCCIQPGQQPVLMLCVVFVDELQCWMLCVHALYCVEQYSLSTERKWLVVELQGWTRCICAPYCAEQSER